jgi:hypothetical protein
MRVAVAAVPYFPRRRVGSWHDSYLRCWNTAGATCGCAVAQPVVSPSPANVVSGLDGIRILWCS